MKQERLTLADFDRINRELMSNYMTPSEVSSFHRKYIERENKKERVA